MWSRKGWATKKEKDPGVPISENAPEEEEPQQELRHEPEEDEQVAPAIQEPPVPDSHHLHREAG